MRRVLRSNTSMNGFASGEGPENTRSMSLEPDNREEMTWLEKPQEGVSLLVCLSGADFKELVDYPIIVERWDHKKGGRVKREWMKQFTEAERNLISRYYAKFYRWYLVSGTPRKVVFRKIKTIQTLQRAVDFFASV